MVDVVILAGGPVKEGLSLKILKSYYRAVYKEHYLWGRYKPLKHITLDGEERPMLDYVIEAASKMKLVDHIEVVCEKDLVEKELGSKTYHKPVKYTQQEGSLLENTLKGYGDRKEHVLFLPCDIPKANSRDLDDFVSKCIPFQEDYDFLSSMVAKESMPKDSKKVFRRRYAWVIDDIFNKKNPDYKGQNWFNKSIDLITNIYAILTRKKHLIETSLPKRRGFRSGNLMYLNLSKLENKEGVNDLYSIRKLRDIRNILRVAKEAFPETIAYYRGRLTLSQFDNMVSRFLKTNTKVSIC